MSQIAKISIFTGLLVFMTVYVYGVILFFNFIGVSIPTIVKGMGY